MLPKKNEISFRNLKNSVRKEIFINLVSKILRKEARGFCHTSKQIGDYIGVSERTARNWLNAVRGPSAYDLIKLMIYSKEIRNMIFAIIDNKHELK